MCVCVCVCQCECRSVSVEVSVFKGFSGRTLRNAFGKKDCGGLKRTYFEGLEKRVWVWGAGKKGRLEKKGSGVGKNWSP